MTVFCLSFEAFLCVVLKIKLFILNYMILLSFLKKFTDALINSQGGSNFQTFAFRSYREAL